MTDQRMIEELAKIDMPDGYVGYARDYPDYLSLTEGYNHMHRIINGMSRGKAEVYATHLVLFPEIVDNASFVQTTVMRMAQAILRAYDVFEED